jgi:hypothetical protein
MSTEHAPKYHSINSVSKELGASRSTITRIIMTSGIAPINFSGRGIAINDQDLDTVRSVLIAEGFEVKS